MPESFNQINSRMLEKFNLGKFRLFVQDGSDDSNQLIMMGTILKPQITLMEIPTNQMRMLSAGDNSQHSRDGKVPITSAFAACFSNGSKYAKEKYKKKLINQKFIRGDKEIKTNYAKKQLPAHLTIQLWNH